MPTKSQPRYRNPKPRTTACQTQTGKPSTSPPDTQGTQNVHYVTLTTYHRYTKCHPANNRSAILSLSRCPFAMSTDAPMTWHGARAPHFAFSALSRVPKEQRSFFRAQEGLPPQHHFLLFTTCKLSAYILYKKPPFFCFLGPFTSTPAILFAVSCVCFEGRHDTTDKPYFFETCLLALTAVLRT